VKATLPSGYHRKRVNQNQIDWVLDMFGLIDVDQGAGLLVVLPGGLFELILPIWLIVKGFNPSAIDSESA
jgi:hypothetical protein